MERIFRINTIEMRDKVESSIFSKIGLMFFLVAFLLTGFSQSIFAQDVRELWKDGNEKYTQGQFAEALANYIKIEEAGYTSEALLYNIGNTYFKLKENGKAILYFERVLKLNPSNADASNNLALAKEYSLDKIEGVPEFILTTWIKDINYSLSSDMWSYISLFLFAAVAVLLLGFKFAYTSRLRKLSFFFGMVALLFGLISAAFAWDQRHNSGLKDSAIVMKLVSTVKSSPDISGKTLFILHEGTKVKLLEELGGWMRVELADGRQGWIISIDIEKI
ncbi:MAG: tetratricopeptide repeat protein [Bacteroidales bacterium]|nr:tetratricopeptide repeat protein [Bacteroidales bacterium]MDD4293154.1 tetratricopeptide repeat protein [Bacteroidales bacterium]